MKIEAAFGGDEKLIVYRLVAGEQTLLVFENEMQGQVFRLGDQFTPRIGENITYIEVPLITSGTPEAIAAVKDYQVAQSTLNRVKNTAISMRDRATDNTQGIQAETLAMFADELQLAIKP